MASQFPDYPQPAGKQQSSNTWLWIVLGVIGGVVALSCMCCGGFFYAGMSVANLGAKEISKKYAGDPNVQEKLGGIDSASMNLSAAIEEGKKGGHGGSIVVLDVTGPKGKGQLIIKGPPDAPGSVTLRVNGQDFPVGAAHDHDHDHGDDEEMEKPAPPATTEPAP